MKRKDFFFLSLLFLSLVIAFWDLWTLNMAFLSGDHREQQFPWAFFLQSQIRQGSFPWWTQMIHAGFPILAEGQIGAFYPLNLLFLFCLPIKLAYNYGILFHYFLGGFLFYFYLRSHKLSSAGSFIASLIFLYGSTQGGYFYYNYISQKVVIWLPLGLWLIDRLLEKPAFRPAFWLAVIFALQIFGGYLQIAVYTILFQIIYFFFFWFKNRPLRPLIYFGSSGLLGLFFSAVQLLPTYELAMHSARATAEKGLAYIGSMSPLGFLTLVYPSWDGLLGSELYVGLLGLFLFAIACYAPKTPPQKFFIFSTLLFLLMALGKHSPLYRLLIEVTHFYSFRTPIKFLFFVSFSMAILTAYGFDHLFSSSDSRPVRRSKALLLTVSSLTAFVPFLGQSILEKFRPQFLPYLERYVSANIFGQPGHPHPLDFYMEKTRNFYDSVIRMLDLKMDFHTQAEWGILLLFILFLLLISRHRFLNGKPLKVLFAALLFLDLYRYGATSIRSNYEPFDSIRLISGHSKILSVLQSEKERPFRMMTAHTIDSQSLQFPIYPSSNMLWGIEDLGAYSPLIMREYRDELKGWGGYLNDSIAVERVDTAAMLEHLDDLGELNVKYLLSPKPLDHPHITLAAQDGAFYLYQNMLFKPRFLWQEKLSGSVPDNFAVPLIPPLAMKLTDYQQNRMMLTFDAAYPGTLNVSNLLYPGWTASLDGKKIPIGQWKKLFMALEIPAGQHTVTIEYRPVLFQRIGLSALITFVLLALGTSIKKPAIRKSL